MVVASSISFAILITIALIASLASKTVGHWLDAFVAAPLELVNENPRGTLGSIILALIFSTAIGLTLGRKTTQDLLRGIVDGDNDIEATVSSWWKAFELMPDAVKIVSVQQKCGRWIQGELKSWTPSADDSLERGIVLVGKINFRAPGSKTIQVLSGTQSLVIQASEIDYFGVDYVSEDAARLRNE